jgi:hypothetical protein
VAVAAVFVVLAHKQAAQADLELLFLLIQILMQRLLASAAVLLTINQLEADTGFIDLLAEQER